MCDRITSITFSSRVHDMYVSSADTELFNFSLRMLQPSLARSRAVHLLCLSYLPDELMFSCPFRSLHFVLPLFYPLISTFTSTRPSTIISSTASSPWFACLQSKSYLRTMPILKGRLFSTDGLADDTVHLAARLTRLRRFELIQSQTLRKVCVFACAFLAKFESERIGDWGWGGPISVKSNYSGRRKVGTSRGF